MYVLNIGFMIQKFPTMLVQGALVTIKITVIALVLATIVGTVLALFRISKNPFLQCLGAIYVWIFRGVPILLQLFFLYYAFPTIGILLSPFVSSIIALTLVASSYMCEIMRGGILGIDKGQFEAAKSLGFTYRQQMFHIIIPQTLRAITPPVGNEFIGIMKDTSIVSTVAMVETMRVAQQIGSTTFKYIEIYIDAAIIYLLLNSVFNIVFKKVETYLKKHS